MNKILVVEDHPDMLDLLITELKLMGYQAIPARNGKEGLEKALEEKPDLILMDIMMPGMDGWEATRALRAQPESHDVPILAETALFRASDLRSCVEAGCNDYLVKPFTYQELEEKVKEFLPAVH
ncbi:MAG: response regulator [Deltaproteobacteria bacterium]|nr:response regulator [Deltaproteobacteria bacterium]